MLRLYQYNYSKQYNVMTVLRLYCPLLRSTGVCILPQQIQTKIFVITLPYIIAIITSCKPHVIDYKLFAQHLGHKQAIIQRQLSPNYQNFSDYAQLYLSSSACNFRTRLPVQREYLFIMSIIRGIYSLSTKKLTDSFQSRITQMRAQTVCVCI